MNDKLVDVESMGLHYSGEHLTPLARDSDPPSTTRKGQVPDETGKGLPMLLTKRSKKDQQLQGLPGGNNSGRYRHRGRDQGPASNDQLGG